MLYNQRYFNKNRILMNYENVNILEKLFFFCEVDCGYDGWVFINFILFELYG